MLLFMWLNFLAALHGHSCIFCCHDNQAWPALGRSVCTNRVSTVVWGSNTEWPLLMPHRKCVRSISSKTKAPDQPVRFCFLCGSYWCLLSTYILIYLEKKQGIYSKKKSRYFWSREATCVSDYCHFVMLSENLLDFLEELYNIPNDLMFHWKNIYKF